MKLLPKLFLAFCAFASSASSDSFEELASNLEQVLSSKGGTCDSGSIQKILDGSQANCLAFIDIVLALDSVGGDAEAAALKLLIGNVDITEESLRDEDKEIFVDESSAYDFETKEGVFDIFACNVEEILDGNNAVGTRSNPRCVEDRIEEAEAVRVQHGFLAQTSGATDSDASDSSASAAPEAGQDPPFTIDNTASDEATSVAPETEAPGTGPPDLEDPQTEAPGTVAPGIRGYESSIPFLEERLSLGGTCESGSIRMILAGEDSDGGAGCDAFSTVAAALAAASGDFVRAAHNLALANVEIAESSLTVPTEGFVDENPLYRFSPIAGEYDEYGCEKEDITEIATGMIVGMRSDPDCVFLRVADIHIVILVEGANPVPPRDIDFPALEARLSVNGTCESGSIDIILSGGVADCRAFDGVVSALGANNLNFRDAADALLLERISVNAALDVAKDDLIHDNIGFRFTHESDNFDDLGCHVEDIIERSSGDQVGTRSDPECTLLRVAQIEVALVVKWFVNPSMGNNSEAVNTTITSSGDSRSNGTVTSVGTEEGVLVDEGVHSSNETESSGQDLLDDEGIPLDMESTIMVNSSNNFAAEGIPLILPTNSTNQSYVPVDVTGYNEKNEIDFGNVPGGDLVCINETIALDKIPSVGHEQDFVSNNRRIQEQVFLINQKLLDYSEVGTDNFKSACAANSGVFRIVNSTSLCRRRSIFEERILQRINYIGRNFPVCAGQQCSEDDDYNLIFAHSLLTGHEFYDKTGEGEFWTCSGAWSTSISAFAAMFAFAVWLIM